MSSQATLTRAAVVRARTQLGKMSVERIQRARALLDDVGAASEVAQLLEESDTCLRAALMLRTLAADVRAMFYSGNDPAMMREATAATARLAALGPLQAVSRDVQETLAARDGEGQ